MRARLKKKFKSDDYRFRIIYRHLTKLGAHVEEFMRDFMPRPEIMMMWRNVVTQVYSSRWNIYCDPFAEKFVDRIKERTDHTGGMGEPPRSRPPIYWIEEKA